MFLADFQITLFIPSPLSYSIWTIISKCILLQPELINSIRSSHHIFKNFPFMPIIKERDKYLSKRDDYMKYSLKNRLFVIFIIGFCFIVFNSTIFADDSGGIQQKKHSGLENPETASQHEKESLSNQFV